MRFRSLAMSTLWIGLFVTTVMALRAADDKAKGKDGDEVPPSPGTIKFATAPTPVQKTFKDETKNAKIDLLGKSVDGEFYMAIVGIGKNDYKLAVSKNGQLLEKVMESVRTEDVTLKDCPAPVQKTFEEEAKGGKITGIARESEGKRSDYLFDVTIQKTGYQIVITEDGTLYSKILDREDPAAVPKGNAEKPEAPVKKPK